jgi:ParB-like chromosome segregation protein Spo0J
MNEQVATLVSKATTLFEQLESLSDDERMEAINQLRFALHEHSPMKENPVDCVLWIKQEEIEANSYNPNSVAPPEMALLERSIAEDGYTQPVVVWREKGNHHYEIIDGFHRSLIGRSTIMRSRVQGRLPVTIANQDRTAKADRMASTIRHNRARGEHSIELMQNVVAELVQSGMSDKWIMQHIGMDVDELLRLKQLTGLVALFRNAEFSRSWVAGEVGEGAE